MNKNYSQTEEYTKHCENIELLLKELELAKIGVDNLKFTYQQDPNTASQLDIVILKINTTLKDISNKLLYFKSYIPFSCYQTQTQSTHHTLDAQAPPTPSYDSTHQYENTPYDISMTSLSDNQPPV